MCGVALIITGLPDQGSTGGSGDNLFSYWNDVTKLDSLMGLAGVRFGRSVGAVWW